MTVNKRNQVLAKKRKLEKQYKASETNDSKKLRLEKHAELDKQLRASETNDARKFRLQQKSEVDKQHRTSETDDARQLRLTNKRKAYKSKMSLLNNQKETNADKNDSASNLLTRNLTNITQNVSKAMYLNGFDMLRNGALHDGENRLCNNFINLCYVICQGTVCKEAWPINAKPKSEAGYTCSCTKKVFQC